MAIQEALTPYNEGYDYSLDSTGNIKMVSGSEEVALHLTQRLQFIQGEWIFDVTVGLPFDEIFTRPAIKTEIDSLIKTRILETSGVTSIVEYSSFFDFSARTAAINFRYTDIYATENDLSITLG